jgi:hypothetical protein
MKLQVLIQNLENRVNQLIARAKSGIKGLRNLIVEILFRISKLEKKLSCLNQQKEEKPMTAEEIIHNLESWEIPCKLWEKHGFTRVYVNEYEGKKSFAYLENKDNEWKICNHHPASLVEKCFSKNPNPINPVKAGIEPQVRKSTTKAKTKEEKIERYLDSQYGRGGWDSRDFIDAEEMECFQ